MSNIINKASPGNNDAIPSNTTFSEDVPKHRNKWAIDLHGASQSSELINNSIGQPPEYTTISMCIAPPLGEASLNPDSFGIIAWGDTPNSGGIALTQTTSLQSTFPPYGAVWMFKDAAHTSGSYPKLKAINTQVTDWTHLVFTYGEEKVSTYQDGVLVDSITRNSKIEPLTDSPVLKVGHLHNQSPGNYHSAVRVSNVAIWDKELSITEVAKLAQQSNHDHLNLLGEDSIQKDNLKYWWRMGDGFRGDETKIYNAATPSGEKKLEIVNATFSTVIQPEGPFKNNYSVVLDGSNHIECGDLSTATSLGAISFWAKPDTQFQNGDASGALSYLFGMPNAGNFHGLNTGFWGQDSAKWMFGFWWSKSGGETYKSFWDAEEAGYKLSDAWHHIVMTHNGTGYTFYVDGQLASDIKGSITVHPQAIITGSDLDSLLLGKGYHSYLFKGKLDEVAIWNEPLTAADISKIYNNGTPSNLKLATSYDEDKTSVLGHYWRMGDDDGGVGATITDKMGGSNATLTAPEYDSPSLSTPLLIQSDTTNGSTTFLDSSPYKHTITPSPGVEHSTAQKQFGSSSMHFNSSFLSIPNDNCFNFKTGAFTLEFWIRYTQGGSYQTIYSYGYANVGAIALQTSNASTPGVIVYLGGNSGGNMVVEPNGAALNTWYHYAIVRTYDGIVTIYRDGVSVASESRTYNVSGSWPLLIGKDSTHPFYGYMEDIRVTSGAARYTSNFAKPTEPHPS